MAESSTVSSLRIPDVLRARIDAAAGEGKRSEWILEACRMRLDGGVAKVEDAPDTGSDQGIREFPGFAGSSPGPAPKVSEETRQALRDICDGNIAGPVSADNQEAFPRQQEEIPICGKTWWEDGEQYECLMDKGHREALANKHGLRGMVRKLEL